MPMTFSRNAEIYGDNEPAEYIYKLLSGNVRTYKVLSDGRRQIGSFYLPGDTFGIEMGLEHGYSAEAITEVKVLMIKRSAVRSARGARCRRGTAALGADALRTAARAGAHIAADQDRAGARRAASCWRWPSALSGSDQVDLPMSRQDIADYLGLTIETVSRTLTSLEHAAAIGLPSSRRVVLRNPAALRRLTRQNFALRSF